MLGSVLSVFLLAVILGSASGDQAPRYQYEYYSPQLYSSSGYYPLQQSLASGYYPLQQSLASGYYPAQQSFSSGSYPLQQSLSNGYNYNGYPNYYGYNQQLTRPIQPESPLPPGYGTLPQYLPYTYVLNYQGEREVSGRPAVSVPVADAVEQKIQPQLVSPRYNIRIPAYSLDGSISPLGPTPDSVLSLSYGDYGNYYDPYYGNYYNRPYPRKVTLMSKTEEKSEGVPLLKTSENTE